MKIPNSTEIKENQNSEENIRLQCAAGYYYNAAERLNFLCWLICGLSAIFVFWSESMPAVILMVILDTVFFIVGIVIKYNTKCAADLRELFDSRVLFGNNGDFNETEVRYIREKAISITKRHKKNYEKISVSDGKGKPPGKKDWYVFSYDLDALYAQLECQSQNRWWNGKMISMRRCILCCIACITVVVGILLFVNLSLPKTGLINAVAILFWRLIERIKLHIKYYNTSISIDTMYKSASENLTVENIIALQKYIDKRRHLAVFEMNVVHKIFAAKWTELYEEISK